MPAWHRLHRSRADDADEPGVGDPAARQPAQRVARADGRRAVPAPDEVDPRAPRPLRSAVLPERRAGPRRGGVAVSALAERLLADRSRIYSREEPVLSERAAEGGCGVTGFACTVPVGGRFIYEPSVQMHNRGNGKGGGIAAVGFVPEEMGVSREVLDSHYLLQIALLDPSCHAELERRFVLPHFDIALSTRQAHLDDHRDIPGLEVRPPDVHRYVVRVKPEVLERFAASPN